MGLALLAFGSGPIRGFAVVHCLGILTSMFSSVVGVRALANLWYGRKKLTSISIGEVWKPRRTEQRGRPGRLPESPRPTMEFFRIHRTIRSCATRWC